MSTEAERPPRPPSDDDGGTAEPVDYAALNAVYGVILSCLVVASRERARRDPIGGGELLPMGAATFALSKVIARERIGTWMREPFVDDAAGDPRPRGRRLRRAVGELLTCSRCVGAWSAAAVVGLRIASPPAGRTVTAVLAASAVNDFLQTGFRWACEKSNQAS